jgi:hypothetical protein
MVTIRLLGAESNGINQLLCGRAGLQRWSSRSESHLAIQRERPGQSGHRQAALLYGLVLNNTIWPFSRTKSAVWLMRSSWRKGLRDLTMAQRLALTMFYRSLQTDEAIEILLKQKLVEDALLAAMVAFSGLGKLRLDPRIVRIMHEVIGVPLKYFPLLAACEFVGAHWGWFLASGGHLWAWLRASTWSSALWARWCRMARGRCERNGTRRLHADRLRCSTRPADPDAKAG